VITKEVKLFYSYSHKDKRLRDKFEDHLAGLKHRGRISGWHDQMVEPGMEWRREIEKQLKAADIILLLLSPHFMNSDYCYSEEMQQALERHKAGETRIIPILLNYVYLEDTPIAHLQILPRDGKAITDYNNNRDKVFREIVAEIDQVVSGLLAGVDRVALALLEDFKMQIFSAGKSDEEWINNVLARMNTTPFLQGIIDTVGYEKIIEEIKTRVSQDKPQGETTWIDTAIQRESKQSKIGDIVTKVETYHSNNEAFQWWLDLLTPALICIFDTLSIHYLKLAQRALRVILGFREYDMIDDWETLYYEATKQTLQARIAYRHARTVLQRDPANAQAHYVLCIAFIGLREYDNALPAIEHAEKLDPKLIGIYDLKCLILTHLGRFIDALEVLEQAIEVNPNERANYEKARLLLEHLREPGRWEQKVTALVQPPVVEPLLLPQAAQSLEESRSSILS